MTEAVEAQKYRDLVDKRLLAVVDGFSHKSPKLAQAMAEAVSPMGKRFRGTLMLLIGAQMGDVSELLIDSAAAIEILHAASLVIDDLPSMDDAELRRGKATIHRAFGEDTAILTGIALVAEALGFIARGADLDFEKRTEIVEILSRSIGSDGLCAGQELDLHASKSAETVMLEQDLKTGALFVASMECIAVAQSLSAQKRADLARLGLLLGRVFQLCDDLQDHMGSEAKLGKDIGKDANGDVVTAGVLAVSSLDEAIAIYRQMMGEVNEIFYSHWPEDMSIQSYVGAVLPDIAVDDPQLGTGLSGQNTSLAG